MTNAEIDAQLAETPRKRIQAPRSEALSPAVIEFAKANAPLLKDVAVTYGKAFADWVVVALRSVGL